MASQEGLQPITHEKKDFCHEKQLKKFLDEARKGYIMDLKITSSYSVLESGKLKIVTENPDTIDTVRLLLDDNWSLLSPEDLTTSAGQAFWTISPASLYYFGTLQGPLTQFPRRKRHMLPASAQEDSR